MSGERMRDHVGLLQELFVSLLMKMRNSINAIQNAYDPQKGDQLDPNTVTHTFDQLPLLAEDIIKNVKEIDAVIDEANEKTWIGKDISEILEGLKDESAVYVEDVKSLNKQLKEAEEWQVMIRENLDLIAKNTPWM